MNERRKLYRHQERALELMRASWAQQKAARRPIRTAVQGPTAFAEPGAFPPMARGMTPTGPNPTGIGVPPKHLTDQTSSQLKAAGIRPGEIGVTKGAPPRHKPLADIQICTPQTLQNRSLPP